MEEVTVILTNEEAELFKRFREFQNDFNILLNNSVLKQFFMELK